MRRTCQRLLIVGVSAFAILISSAAFATPSKPQKPMLDRLAVATELVAANQLVLETGADFEKAVLTVSGPKNFRSRQEFRTGETIAVDLASAKLEDGRYRYTLRVSPKTDRGVVKMGVFFVDNGALVSRDSKRSQLEAIRGKLNLSRRQKVEEAAAKLGSKREQRPASRAGQLRSPQRRPTVAPGPEGYYPYYGGLFGGYVGIYGYGPLLYFYELPYGLPDPAGYYPPYGLTGFFLQYYGVNYRFSQYANYDYAYYNVNSGIYNINVGYGNYDYGIINYQYGILNLRYAVYANADFGYYNLRYALFGPNVEYSYGVDYGSGFYGGYNIVIGAGYDLYHSSFEYQALYVGPSGVGIGTYSPEAQLHVYGYGGSGVLVDETEAGEHVLFALRNPGKTRFLIKNTAVPAGWTFDVDNASRFSISKAGTGVNEFLMYPNGNLTILGSLTESSSRSVKKDFASVNGEDVLAEVVDLPLLAWSYKDDPPGVRHMGPMAEDFFAAFQLGHTDKGIASLDTSGVALAAIQGLNTKLASLETENAALRSEVTELKAIVQALIEK